MSKAKFALITGILMLAAVFVANADYGNYMPRYNENSEFERGAFHEDMESIVEQGSFEDLETYRAENSNFGGPRWVTDQASFETWQEMHQEMESEGYEPGYLRGSGKGQGRIGGCPMRG